jgi:hypothetical protein
VLENQLDPELVLRKHRIHPVKPLGAGLLRFLPAWYWVMIIDGGIALAGEDVKG